MEHSNKPAPARAGGRHRHTMRCVGYRGNFTQLIFRCGCGREAERSPTPAERRRLEREQHGERRRHALAERFYARFTDRSGPILRWRLESAALIESIRRWARRYPTIKLARVDDAVHAGALWVFIPADDPEFGLWGVDVICISQMVRQEPAVFFLYPDALDELMAALRALRADTHRAHRRRSVLSTIRFCAD